MKKVYSLLLFVLVAASSAFAGPITSAGSGNWNSTTPNAPWPGGVVPSASDDVSIRPGDNITVTADATINLINFANTSATSRTLTVNSGVTLTVTSGITLENSLTTNTAATIAGTGTISCGSFTVGGTALLVTVNTSAILTSTISNLDVSGNLSLIGVDNGSKDNDATFNLQSGIVSVAGSVVLNEVAGTAVLFSLASGTQTGTLRLSGATPFTITGSPTFTADGNNATVDYSGGAQTVRGTTYTNLVLSGSGSKTMTGVTVTDKLSIDGTATAGTTFSYSSAILEYKSTSAQATTNNEFPASTSGISEVIINNAAGVTLNAAKTLNGSLTLTSGTLAAGNFLTMGSGGTPLITISGGSITGTMQGAFDYDVTYTGNSKTTGPELSGSGHADINVSLTSGQTLTLDQNRIPDGSINVTSGIFDLGSFTISRSGSGGAITVSAGATLKIGGTNSLPSNYTTKTFNATSTVEYEGANQSIGNATYGHLVTSGSGTKTISASHTVAGNLTIGNGTTLDANAFTVTLGSGSVVTVNGTLDFTNATGVLRTGNNLNATLTMTSNGVIRTFDDIGLGPVANASLQNQGTGVMTTTSLSTNGTVEYYRNATSGQTITDRDYNNLTISGNTQVKTWTLAAARTVNGTLTISANAPLTFGAGTQTLNLKGDWINNSSAAFTPASVKINLNGSAVQAVGGLVETKFADLTFNNAAGFSLGNNVTVNGAMVLTNGIINAASNILTVGAAASVTGASDASFVDGKVKKVGAVGGTSFDFPVGKTGVGHMKIGMANVTGATTEFTAQYFRASATLTFDTVGLAALGIQAVSNCEYWTLDRAVTSSNADVTLYWNAHSSCNGSYLSDPLFGIRVVHYNSSLPGWDAHGGGSPLGDASSGSVTWSGVSNFSPFALGALYGSQSGLPVMFNDVKAYEKNHGVQIEWTNLTERDLVSYIVEHSANGVSYTAINQQLPKSNNNDKQSYSTFDAAPLSGANYYRVKVLEISGKVIYSKVVRVDIGKNGEAFTLYPNPVKGNLVSVSISNKQGRYTLKVINTAGQEIYSQKINHQGGSMTQTIELPVTMKPGVYNMMISGDNYREAKMFIVQ